MSQLKEDKRIVRTRNALKDALLNIMKDKDFKDITATEITKSAGCNRVTFYSHYPDKETLLQSIFADYMEGFVEQFRSYYKDGKPFDIRDETRSIKLFKYVKEHSFIFKMILKGEILPGSQNYFCDTISKVSESDLRLLEDSIEDINIDALRFYQVYASLGLFLYWVDSDFKESPEYMSKQASKFLQFTPTLVGVTKK
ncbi:TetR/AcrR family transcriptional regulator [Fredinandcohnia humi]